MLPAPFKYACFVSFAEADKTADRSAFIHFLERLHYWLDQMGHRSPPESAYFLIDDKRGGDFRRALEAGTRQSVCLLSLYSPRFWDSPECEAEFDAFNVRDTLAVLGMPDAAMKPELFALPWIHHPTLVGAKHSDKVFAPHVTTTRRAMQYFRDEHAFPTIYDNGLCKILNDNRLRDTEGERFIEAIAHQIGMVVGALRRAILSPVTAGRKGALYVLAAKPEEVRQELAKLPYENLDGAAKIAKIQSYRDAGGHDWHPFDPDRLDKSISVIVSQIINTDKFDYIVGFDKPELPIRLVDAIRHANELKQYVILVLDPWSVCRFGYLQTVLSHLDEYTYTNCIILLVRGENDSIYAVDESEIDNTIAELFPSTSEAFFFRKVTSEGGLRGEIEVLLTKLRTKLQAKRARAVDISGPDQLPRLSNAKGR